jgi:hypothetical protein
MEVFLVQYDLHMFHLSLILVMRVISIRLSLLGFSIIRNVSRFVERRTRVSFNQGIFTFSEQLLPESLTGDSIQSGDRGEKKSRCLDNHLCVVDTCYNEYSGFCIYATLIEGWTIC